MCSATATKYSLTPTRINFHSLKRVLSKDQRDDAINKSNSGFLISHDQLLRLNPCVASGPIRLAHFTFECLARGAARKVLHKHRRLHALMFAVNALIDPIA